MQELLKVGTRASKLALQQTRWVISQLEDINPDLQFEIVEVKTTGDKILDVPLAKIGGKGLFIKELEEALLNGQVDFVVHSMKDVPIELHPELQIAAITVREDPRDVLISRNNLILKHLPKDAVVGTSSLRRQTQLLHYSPTFQIVQLRGNLETRLRRVEGNGLDAVILAAAGIHRMGWQSKIVEYLPMDMFLPAIAQGALGIEVRQDRPAIAQFVMALDHQETRIAVLAERALLKKLEGGCQVPLAAFAEVTGDQVFLQAMVGSLQGDIIIRDVLQGPIDNPEEIGLTLAQKLIDQGADEILKEIFETNQAV
ncbi:MAG: hydroxymethylbilane synthase [bacterium]